MEGYPQLQKLPFDHVDAKIGILVGLNAPNLIQPLEIVSYSKYDPKASKHLMGLISRQICCNKRSEVTQFYFRTNAEHLNDKTDKLVLCDFELEQKSLYNFADDYFFTK